MGEFSIELSPSYKNIVIAPVIPESTFIQYPAIQAKMDELNNAAAGTDTANQLIDFGFYQLDQPMKNKFKLDTAGTTVTLLDQVHTWKSERNHETMKPSMELATFYLKEDVSNNLRNEYTNIPLLMPIQVVEWSNFTSTLGNESNASPSATPSFKSTDAAYILFRENDVTSTQRFINPGIEHQTRIGGRQYPTRPYKTLYDQRNTNLTLDAFNINNHRLVSVSEDIRTSMQPYTKYTAYASTGAAGATVERGVEKYHWSTGDRGRFFIAFPFCDSNIFQGGLTLGKDVIEMKINRLRTECPPKLAAIKYQSPVIVTTSDRILKIRSFKPDGSPQAEITTATFDELMGVR
jgi:hypothetical protein